MKTINVTRAVSGKQTCSTRIPALDNGLLLIFNSFYVLIF